jgi:adenylate kinase
MLAERTGWRWLSAGQLLRDTHDPELLKEMETGELVSHENVTRVMGEAIAKNADSAHLILDGFPREIEQATWLVDSQPMHGRSVSLVIVLDVPREEVLARLSGRGRVDDTPEAIDERLAIYAEETTPILDFFAKQGIAIVHIEGSGKPEQVQERIMDALKAYGVTQ